jgi:GAF domain-containing protein
VLGVLQVLDRRVDAFTAEDRALVEGISTQVAAVLDHESGAQPASRTARATATELQNLVMVFQFIAGASG